MGVTIDRGRFGGPAVLVYGLLALAAVPGFVWLAPPSRWDDAGTIAALAVISLIACTVRGRLPSGLTFDASVALVVPALAVGGALPACLVMLVPTLAGGALRGRNRLVSVGMLAEVGAFGWQAIAGAAALRALGGPGDLAALLAAGLVMSALNAALILFLYGRLELGRGFRALLAEARPTLLPEVAVVVVACLAAVLLGAVGVWALLLLAAAAIIPQLVAPLAAAPRPAADVDRDEAARSYAVAIARALRLGRRERRVVAAAAELLPSAPFGVLAQRARLPRWRSDDLADVVYAVLHAREHFDGGGTPGGLSGLWIPRASRILAVAEAWSGLTAAGTAELPHRQALLDLQARAGSEFDPEVVAAAAAAMPEEQVVGPAPAYEPERPLRRAVLGGLGLLLDPLEQLRSR